MIIIHRELYSSKNSKQIFFNRKTGKSFIAKSNVCLAQENALEQELILNRKKICQEIDSLPRPFYVAFKIYRKTKRRVDATNIVQQLLDCMVRVGILEDDNVNVMLPFFYPFQVDPKNPRVEISVEPLEKFIK